MKLIDRFSKGTQSILNADLTTAIKSFAGFSTENFPIIKPSEYRHESGEFWNLFKGDNPNHFTFTGAASCVEAYEKCPPVASIIGRKAQAYINGKFWILNTSGKEATGTYATFLRRLFRKPNPIQSFKQFRAQGYYYVNLFGWNVVLTVRPFGFENKTAIKSMWNIPPSMIDIEETKKIFYQSDTKGMIKQIVLNYAGVRTVLDVDNIFIQRDTSPNFNTMLLPQSRLASLTKPVNNIIGAYESRNVLINYRGALGILSTDPGSGQYASLPLKPQEKIDLQNDFRKYGVSDRQWQFIITSASLKWQQMGVATKDLMLFEEIDADTMAICDAYGYPYRLMSTNTANSLGGSDAKEFKAQLYQDTIIPEADNLDEQWGLFFEDEENNIRIDTDFSHVPVLAEDQSDAMTARKTRNEAYQIEWDNDLITRNQWRAANGEDPVDGEDKRKSELAQDSKQPLASVIGVGGVQSLLSVLQSNLPAEAKINTLEIVFGIPAADAKRMVGDPNEQTNSNEQENTEESGDTGQSGDAGQSTTSEENESGEGGVEDSE